jgi:hypothetical protein
MSPHPSALARALLLAALPALLASPLAAQEPAAPAVARTHAESPMSHAARLDGAIRIDGRLDEEAWARATPITAFTQLDPAEGQPASERTEVRILFDEGALYIGARLYDREPVTTRLGRRDQGVTSDWLTVIFDSNHDHRTAFGFEVNPSGVRRDQTRSPNGEDDSWDPVWQAATSIDGEGWTAELRIPFSQLRFDPGAEQVWGLQIERQIARVGEFSVWSFTPRSEPGGIPRFGHLHGLRELRTGKRAELLPYAVARGESVQRNGNPFRSDRSAGGAVGLDAKYRVTSNLTLDATLNPDFGQVEVDPAEVNLSAIESFFQERRPFFVEGAEIFNFGSGGGNNVFYSRRIGRAPQLPAPGVADVPDAARILAAGKLSGRTADGWSIGVLNATTERVQARHLGEGGGTEHALVEPFTNYFVGRLRRDFRAGQSVLGGMLTAVNRDLEPGVSSDLLHAAAYTGGVDFQHQWAARTWTLSGFVSGSHVRGSEAALQRTQRLPWHYFHRPDADHLELRPERTSLTGAAMQTTLSHRRGRNWRANATLGTITPGYELNDLGFQYRADRFDAQIGGSYGENRPGRLFRQYQFSTATRHEWNYAGDAILRNASANVWAQFLNYWSVNASAATVLPSMDDRLTRGGPIARRPANRSGFLGVNSDWRKPVAGFLGSSFSANEHGGWTHGVFSELEIKPGPTWSIGLGPSLNRSYSVAQYLTARVDETATHTFGRRYVFSDLRQTTLSLDTRLNLTLTPDLSLQIFAQPFVASGDFGAPAEFAAPGEYRFEVYGRDRGEVDRTENGVRVYPEGRTGAAAPFVVADRDFNVRSLRGNAVMRWEWRPGSTLFVAWQQQRSDFEPVGDFRFRRDQAALWAAQPDNVLVVKLNYWLNP